MDVRGVAGCLPGASIGGDTEDGGLEATVAVKVGPIRMSYGGTVHVIERDDAARTASMRVRAREQRGQGTAEATLGLAVVADGDGGSRATVTTDLMVTGRVAQMGAGIMQDVAGSMVNDFAACLSARMGPAQARLRRSRRRLARAASGQPRWRARSRPCRSCGRRFGPAWAACSAAVGEPPALGVPAHHGSHARQGSRPTLRPGRAARRSPGRERPLGRKRPLGTRAASHCPRCQLPGPPPRRLVGRRRVRERGELPCAARAVRQPFAAQTSLERLDERAAARGAAGTRPSRARRTARLETP